ncbi:MAG: pyridoxamine 5'-phosphate oxidase family protein [Myxococcales bacterium]|nr:pyridoxamine 5'-phosphate oxidase family protein [Myxococcales bacterium]
MSDFYSTHQRTFQDAFATRGLADRVESMTVHDFVRDSERAFIESRDMFFLATIDERGMPTVSYKGGDPGFVQVRDEKTLCFPIYNGNGMFLSAGNISGNGKVGLLFIDFEKPNRLRVHGRATAEDGDTEVSVGSELLITVTVEEVFVNCPRYIHRYRKVEPSAYVPRENGPTPLPDWKRIDGLQDVLSEEERTRAREAGLLTLREFAKLQEGQL